MPRCCAVRRPVPGAIVQCKNNPEAASAHYMMVYDPRMRVPPGTTFYFCPPCIDKAVKLLVAEEQEIQLRMIKSARRAKSLVRGGHESAQERNRLWGEVERLKGSRTHLRSRYCRLCNNPLKGYEDEPHLQVGPSFAHLDVHSAHGYGRAWLMFHTECIVRWLKLNVALPPRLSAAMEADRLPKGQRNLLAST